MSIKSFFLGLLHAGGNGLGTIGMIAGAIFGAIGGVGSLLLSKITGGKFKLFPGSFKHTVLSSALGWGSLLTFAYPAVRLNYVGPTVNTLARDFGAAAAPGDVIPGECSAGPPGYQWASVPASWGLEGPLTIHQFVGNLIAEPWTSGLVPAGSCSASGNLTVPTYTSTPGMIGALASPSP